MAPRITREHGAVVLLAALVSILTGLLTLWAFTNRVFANEIRAQVKSEIGPVLQVQKLLLESEIDSRRLGIAAMEYKREMCANSGIADCWTIRDAQDLTKARAELSVRELALRGLD